MAKFPFPRSDERGSAPRLDKKRQGDDLGHPGTSKPPDGGENLAGSLPLDSGSKPTTTEGYHPSNAQTNAGNRGRDLGHAE